MTNPGELRLVGRERRTEIDALRRQEYATAAGFSVDLSTLEWRESDDQSFVLAALDGGRCISTMRGEVIGDLALLERKLECPWRFQLELAFPVLLLSRAATAAPHRARGLNLVLRHWFIRFALHHGLGAVVGTFVSGSARENTLRAMGYRFFANELGWRQSTYRSLGPVTVAVLDLKESGERALRHARAHAGDALGAFAAEPGFPELRIVRTL